MRALVVSDTHGNLKFLQKVVNFAVENLGVESLWHLGDNYEDPVAIDRQGLMVHRVPGIYHPGYRSRMLDAVHSMDIFDLTVKLVHDPYDIEDAYKKSTQLFCHGHTHKPDVQIERGTIYFNPGHLKHKKDRGYDATFAVVDIEESKLGIEFYSLDGEAVKSFSFEKVGGKMVEKY